MLMTNGVHLIGTNLNELHEFAKGIGLKQKDFFQKTNVVPMSFYYITTSKIFQKAKEKGVVHTTTQKMIDLYKDVNRKAPA
jgi:hypothetical protein